MRGRKLPSLSFALFSLTLYSTISFASEINNSALISYSVGGLQRQISTNSAITTLEISSLATIIGPESDATVPQKFIVIGTSEANSRVEIKIDGITQYSLTSDSNGYYTQEVVFANPGSHSIAVDINGTQAESIEVTAVDGMPANYPEINSHTDGEKIATSRPLVSGKAAPGASVAIYAKASPVRIVGIGTADSGGNFAITLNQDLSGGSSQLFVMDTTNNLASEFCELIFIDPEGVVFDALTNNPLKGCLVTIYNATTNQPCSPGTEIAASDSNPYTTGADGRYSFSAINGNYYLRASVSGYNFPSALSAFPRVITTGSKGEEFSVAGASLTINLPLDAKNNLLKTEKTANKKEAVVGEIVTYTVTIQNESSIDLTDAYLEDKIPPGFRYLSGKTILDNARISDPSGTRALTFNIGTVAANSSRTLKYQLVVGSGVSSGNYENTCFAKYSDGTRISNTSGQTVKIVYDPLFDLGTVLGKVFHDRNENGIQDRGEEVIAYARIVSEDGTIITADKEGRWHLPGLTPGRRLFRIDESTLPEGAYLTTAKAALIDTTRGLISKVNFGVKIPLDKTSELLAAWGLDLQVIEGQASAQPRLNAGLYPQQLEISNRVLADQPLFRIFNNYPLFIEKWKLEIFEKESKKLFKKFSGKSPGYDYTLNWDGLSEEGVALTPGRTYYYILTVEDKQGKEDITAQREFRVEELKQEEKFKQAVLGLRDRKEEFKEWSKLEAGLNNLQQQAMAIKGETVRIMAQGQKEDSGLSFSLDNQLPLSVGPGGIIDAQIILPEGIHKLTLTQEFPQGKPQPLYERQIKIGDSYLFFVALGDYSGGYTAKKGNIEAAQADDKFQEGFWNEGKLAYYLKGKIKGKYLVTSSLDTDRNNKELFKVVDPKKYYPVYGDAATINFAADDTQGQLYCLVEWDKTKITWGNYLTEFNQSEFARFNRALYGGKLSYESLSSTKFGRPNSKLILFNATAKQLAAHNEFLGSGGSLYYLKHRDIIEGSDTVKIEVRDKVTGLTLGAIEQKSGVDYHLDYEQGRIIFWKPVSSIAESSSIISTQLLDGNPVYVVADYQYQLKDKYYEGAYGARASQALGDYLQLGATYVKEEKNRENYELKGLDSVLQINKDTFIKGEYAESKSEQVSNYISTDGGLSFSEEATGWGLSGRAYGLEARTKLFTKLLLDAYYKYVGRNFSGADSIAQQGTKKFGFAVNWQIAANTVFNLRHDQQKLLKDGNSFTQAQVGAEETRTTTAQISHSVEKLTLTGEYRHQESKSALAGIQAQTNQNADIIAAKAGYQLSKKLETSLEYQQALKGGLGAQATAGAIYKIVDWLKIRLSQAVGTKGSATTFGAQLQSPNGKTEAFIDRTFGSGLESSGSIQTSIGIKSQLDEKRDIFGIYTVSDNPLEGKQQVSSFGGSQKVNERIKLSANRDFTSGRDSSAITDVLGLSGEINDRLSMNIAFEKGKVNNIGGSQVMRNAGSINLSYAEKEKLKASAKLELRLDRADFKKQQYLIYNAVEYVVNKIMTFFANINFSGTRNTTSKSTEAKFNEVTLGAALRPVQWDSLNFIAKCTYFDNKQPQGQDNFSNINAEKAAVFALEGIYDFSERIQFAEKLAFKWGEERVAGFDFTKSRTWLLINRLNYKINADWGLSGEYRILAQRQADDRNQGFLLEVNRNINDFFWVGLGYNFSKFSDDLVRGNDYTAQGPYFKVSAKFFDFTAEEMARMKKKRRDRKQQREAQMQIKEKIRLSAEPGGKAAENSSPGYFREAIIGNKGYIYRAAGEEKE